MAQQRKAPLVAVDLMHKDVVVVYDTDTLQDALNLMTENHVTGLPVVNSKNKCVGVITSTDILNYEQEHAEVASEANADVAQHFNPDLQQWESLRVSSFALEEFGEVRVQEVMSPDLVYVGPNTPLKDVATKMSKAKVHRILVISEDLRLYGIISASDFVKLYAES